MRIETTYRAFFLLFVDAAPEEYTKWRVRRAWDLATIRTDSDIEMWFESHADEWDEYLAWLDEHAPTAEFWLWENDPEGVALEVRITDENQAFAYRMRWPEPW